MNQDFKENLSHKPHEEEKTEKEDREQHFVASIDLLCSPQATDRLKSAGVDRVPRGKEKPSDHTPVWCELGD